MPREVKIVAKDKKQGMSIEEIRDAIQGQPGAVVPKVQISFSGRIQAIKLETP